MSEYPSVDLLVPIYENPETPPYDDLEVYFVTPVYDFEPYSLRDGMELPYCFWMN